MIEADGDKVIDRDAEAELFKELLQLQDPRRMFLISDGPQSGKSTLLRKLKYFCSWEHKPRAPAALVRLKELDPNPYSLIEALYRELVEADMEFKCFAPLHKAIQTRDANTFRSAGFVDARNATVSGTAQMAGQIFNKDVTVQVGHGGMAVLGGGQETRWDAAFDTHARERAISVFFEDLKSLSTNALIVLFLDDVDDQANAQLLKWVLEVFVRKVLDAKPRMNVLLVLAGRSQKAPFERFKSYYPELVHSIEALGNWSIEHMRAFLDLNRPAGRGPWPVTDTDIEFLRGKINDRSLTLDGALQMVEILSRRDG